MSSAHSICVAIAILFVTVELRANDSLNATAFLDSFCIECHATDDPSGELELETISWDASHFDMQYRVQDAIDQLTLGAMPPPDSDQPTSQERVVAIRQMTRLLGRMREKSRSTGGKTILRRLNHREYRNTIGDLLSIDMTMFDPTINFPAENMSHGFDNLGDTLVTSSYLLENYLEAASLSVEKAFAIHERPPVQTWVFKDHFEQQQELKSAHKAAFDHRYLCLYDHRQNDKPEGAYGPLVHFKGGVPHDGMYEIEVLAESMHRDTPYPESVVKLDLDEPFRLGIVPGDTRIGDMVHNQPIEPLLGQVTIMDGPPKWYRFRVPLDAGFSPRFTFENGMQDVRGAFSRVYKSQRDTLPKAVRDTKGIFSQRIAVIQHGQLPHIRIHEVRVKGPVNVAWPTAFQASIFGGESFDPKRAKLPIARFANRAFRRPLTPGELVKWFRFYQTRLKRVGEPEVAMKETFKAMMCSPSFLYFKTDKAAVEGDSRRQLSDHAIAERLSYFLTSSPPDGTLLRLARAGKLGNQRELRKQTQRLLKGHKSNRFVADFLDSWLHLRDVGSMPPDPREFAVYYSAGLEEEVKQESRLFFRDLVDRNASALDLIRGNYSFLNRDLAKLYKVADSWGDSPAEEFKKVVFTKQNRGGLLGQASVLTVSANGIETSPVTRGVWILENILGTPTPPPPDDVPAIEPDTRGATTIRDQLEKHRFSAACNDCHRKIDPLGFVLECFDPIGRTRQYYDKKRTQAIDTAGELPGGVTIANLAEFKKWMVEHETFFLRTLTSRLLTHGTGRQMDRSERAEIDEIISRLESVEYPMRSLIEEVVTSDIFVN